MYAFIYNVYNAPASEYISSGLAAPTVPAIRAYRCARVWMVYVCAAAERRAFVYKSKGEDGMGIF